MSSKKRTKVSSPNRRSSTSSTSPSTSSSSPSPPPTLESVLLELEQSRREAAGLRSELAEARAAQERLLERSTWVDNFHPEYNPEGETREFQTDEIIVALKHHFGVAYDDSDAHTLLTQQRFDPNDVRAEKEMWNGGRYTPLHWNCREGDLEMCKWLVANGAADDARKVAAYDGYTPMLTACQFDQLTICRWLFEAAGAAEDIRSAGEENGDTPMLVACGYGHLEVCEWLLGVGAAADARITDNLGNTPLLWACKEGHLPVCEWLVDAAGAAEDVSRANHHGWTPMLMACMNGHLAVCKWLYAAGATADVSRADLGGRTPMHLACEKGYVAIYEWLFEVGAAGHIRVENHEGHTPLLAACGRNRLEECKWLVLKGAVSFSDDGEHGQSGEDQDDQTAAGHVSPLLVERDIRDPPGHSFDMRFKLYLWTIAVQRAYGTFRTFLMGTLRTSESTAVRLRRAYIATGTPAAVADVTIAALPAPQLASVLEQLRPRSPLSKLSGSAGVLELISDFVGGVRRGRELRNVRELMVCFECDLGIECDEGERVTCRKADTVLNYVINHCKSQASSQAANGPPGYIDVGDIAPGLLAQGYQFSPEEVYCLAQDLLGDNHLTAPPPRPDAVIDFSFLDQEPSDEARTARGRLRYLRPHFRYLENPYQGPYEQLMQQQQQQQIQQQQPQLIFGGF